MFDIKVKATKLTAINQELATFNCEDSVSGIAHIQKDLTTTIILDGGYVLGVYDCPACAMRGVHSTANCIDNAEEDFGMNYENYKSVFMAGMSTTKH